MLPYDCRPWARSLAKSVIIISTCALVCLALFLHHIGQLRPPEYVGILLLFLTIVPPNVAILRRKTNPSTPTNSNHSEAIVH